MEPTRQLGVHEIYQGPGGGYVHSSQQSPGGFVFGPQGWSWGIPMPNSITFFLDGTAMVCDQHGRPIRGCMTPEGKEIKFATTNPPANSDGKVEPRPFLASHAQVIAALAQERVDWLRLTRAGWPQLPYEQLKQLADLPPTPEDELAKIPSKELRRAALQMRREWDARLKHEREEMLATDD